VGRVPDRRADELGVERRILIRDVGVERHARVGAVPGVDLTAGIAEAASPIPLAVRRRGRTLAPMAGECEAVVMVDDLGQGLRMVAVHSVKSVFPKIRRIG
jgi:hypothetical protein